MTKLRYDYEPSYCGELLRDNGTSVCSFETEPSPDDARRLVVCWNACDGIDTKYLEGDDSLPHYARRLMAQRDKLLEVLQNFVKEFEGCYADGEPAMIAARAAIQKATNKEQV